jgi:UPF0716 protein FxsA
VRRLVLIIALLVIVPIIEIAVLVAVGQQIGLALTLLLMLGTSALGGWLLRREGGRAWQAFQADLAANRPPGITATDGLLVVIGGIFMLVPGFVSDVVGLFMIAPPTRRIARSVVLRAFTGRISPVTANTLFGPRRVRVRYGQSQPTPNSWPPADRPNGGGSPAASAIEGEIIDPPR